MRIFQAATDAQSTTVNQNNNLYDQIIITAGAFSEFGTTNPVLGEHIGIIAFYMNPPFSGINDHNTIKFRVSDHRPLWIRFRTDFNDDD